MCNAPYRNKTHQAKLANCGAPGIQVDNDYGQPTGTYGVLNPKTKKITSTQDMTFLQKSYWDYNKVEKPVMVTASCQGTADDEELEMDPLVS